MNIFSVQTSKEESEKRRDEKTEIHAKDRGVLVYVCSETDSIHQCTLRIQLHVCVCINVSMCMFFTGKDIESHFVQVTSKRVRVGERYELHEKSATYTQSKGKEKLRKMSDARWANEGEAERRMRRESEREKGAKFMRTYTFDRGRR